MHGQQIARKATTHAANKAAGTPPVGEVSGMSHPERLSPEEQRARLAALDAHGATGCVASSNAGRRTGRSADGIGQRSGICTQTGQGPRQDPARPPGKLSPPLTKACGEGLLSDGGGFLEVNPFGVLAEEDEEDANTSEENEATNWAT